MNDTTCGQGIAMTERCNKIVLTEKLGNFIRD